MKTLTPVLLAASLALGTACGEPTSEDRIEDATAQLLRVEEEVAVAEQVLERETEELAEAQEELSEARETLREAEARLAEAREHLAEVADDDYLFRSVQGALLSDGSLGEEAIRARVRSGVVTLSGDVETEDQKERAQKIALSVPGVQRVENEVTVELAGP